MSRPSSRGARDSTLRQSIGRKTVLEALQSSTMTVAHALRLTASQNIMPALMASSIGFYVSSAEELEPLARSFTLQHYTAGQELAQSPMYFVLSGSASVVMKDTTISKRTGEWIFHKGAMQKHELEPGNYAWSYDGNELHGVGGHRAVAEATVSEGSMLHGHQPHLMAKTRGLFQPIKRQFTVGSDLSVHSARKGRQQAAAAAARKKRANNRLSERSSVSSRRDSWADDDDPTLITRVVATTDCQVFQLTRRALMRFIATSQTAFHAATRSLQLNQLLLEYPPIGKSTVAERDVATLAHEAVFLSYEEGDVVYSEGSRAAGLYLVIRGAVSVTHPPSSTLRPASGAGRVGGGGLLSLAHEQLGAAGSAGGVQSEDSRDRGHTALVTPGGYFGELGELLRWETHSGAAVAKSKTLIAYLPRGPVLDTALFLLPELSESLQFDARRRLLEMCRAERLPFFANLSDDKLRLAARQSSLLVGLTPGEPIAHQGSELDGLYVVITGRVRATRKAVPLDASPPHQPAAGGTPPAAAESAPAGSSKSGSGSGDEGMTSAGNLSERLFSMDIFGNQGSSRAPATAPAGAPSSPAAAGMPAPGGANGNAPGAALVGQRRNSIRISIRKLSGGSTSGRSSSDSPTGVRTSGKGGGGGDGGGGGGGGGGGSNASEWLVNAGGMFGEVPLLYVGQGSAATYTPTSYDSDGLGNTSLLLVPRTLIHSFFDATLLAEVKIKLLREEASLVDILDHPTARRLFALHLDSRRLGASHALAFHTAVNRYIKVHDLATLPAAMLCISQSLVGEFVMRRSPHVVTMSDESREAILEAHKVGAVPHPMLEAEASTIIQTLTKVDLPGFCSSAVYQDLLSSVGSFSAELVACNIQCHPGHLKALASATAAAGKEIDAAMPHISIVQFSDADGAPSGAPAAEAAGGGEIAAPANASADLFGNSDAKDPSAISTLSA